MPKDKSIEKVLLIGSGPIIISQGCEFDYSGTQACKALKEEGCKVILVNPNPATIMTDPDLADATYIEPLVPSLIEKIIEKEKPDALLPTMGGQTALNLTLELDEKGIINKHRIRLIGVTIETIKKAEDREQFRAIVRKIKLNSPKAISIKNLTEMDQKKNLFGYPKIIRTFYSLGGSGSGIAYNEEQLFELCTQAFKHRLGQKILVEESLLGWKEFELEVMIDAVGNFIVVCPIENLDPMGIHTGDSITIAPTQTLTDKEYQIMREAAKKLVREIDMTSGGCNIQFAINPSDGRIVVIEINPRVSRSSALASKATGFPIAKIATKIALGYNLNELSNEITQRQIAASFEPSIDYVVVKIPRFNFDKFPQANSILTTQMKSIGEVMGIGRTFSEALQKAIRSLENGMNGLLPILSQNINFLEQESIILEKITYPNEHRIFYIAEAFRRKWSIQKVGEITHIDLWFLYQIKEIVEIENKLKSLTLSSLTKEDIFFLKRKGFSDDHISFILNVTKEEICNFRKNYKISPVYKRIDSCAAEFPTKTSYLYSTYEYDCEANPTKNRKIAILGSGPNRIGQGIEFDYCCVQAALTAQDLGYETIMINCNPETVSTDYDCCDKLYFEPLTIEDVREIINIEKPQGILSQFGGQTSLMLSQELNHEGYKILGTDSKNIKIAEDRIDFKNVLIKLNIDQPPNKTINNIEEALSFGNKVGYPLILRCSFVIGGKGFVKVNSEKELLKYFKNVSSFPGSILIEKFITDAIEIDVDAISDGHDICVCGVLEQFELAGIHSGDSSCIFPSQNLSQEITDKLVDLTQKLAFELNIIGFMNVQFLIKKKDIYVLEVNPRASRTIPFVCKATGYPFVRIATKVQLGISLRELACPLVVTPPLIAVKKPIFSFDKLCISTEELGVEMKSTGEVMILGKTGREISDKLKFYEKHINQPYSVSESEVDLYPIQIFIKPIIGGDNQSYSLKLNKKTKK